MIIFNKIRRTSRRFRSAMTANVLLLVTAVLFSAPAAAGAILSPSLTLSGTQVTGATNLSVDGGLYDVLFVEGTCASVYGTCSQSSFPFPYTHYTWPATGPVDTAKLATIAFANLFNATPDFDLLSIYGITSTSNQRISTPIYLPAAGYWVMAETWRLNTTNALGTGAMSQRAFAYDSTTDADRVLAVWSPAQSAAAPGIPEPGTLAIFSLGLLGLGLNRRQRKNP
ncbi:PEP-CTERM sorting domain-containing protein [Neptunomonas antarctica]|uniref:PEP-CTERM protein-sorting domain-containing protein n=1 Tax=Neptunomonas antarctica TaxID=619304 RepID=A0A1N7L2R6_9GAMM|nr:PEP-CTERM sorting domain-containing protein [Neptunomonas antarctica]SIS68081.1 PEP-CTERM protein-sorting domain-containing protein [Neptunomonas antarctica]